MPQTMGLAPGYKLRRWRAAVATAHAVCVVCQHVWVAGHVCVCVCAQLQLQSTTTPTQRVEKNMRKFAVKSVGQTRLPCPCPGQTFRFSRFGTQPEPEPEPVQCVCVCVCLADNNPKVLQAKRATITWQAGRNRNHLQAIFISDFRVLSPASLLPQHSCR